MGRRSPLSLVGPASACSTPGSRQAPSGACETRPSCPWSAWRRHPAGPAPALRALFSCPLREGEAGPQVGGGQTPAGLCCGDSTDHATVSIAPRGGASSFPVTFSSAPLCCWGGGGGLPHVSSPRTCPALAPGHEAVPRDTAQGCVATGVIWRGNWFPRLLSHVEGGREHSLGLALHDLRPGPSLGLSFSH